MSLSDWFGPKDAKKAHYSQELQAENRRRAARRRHQQWWESAAEFPAAAFQSPQAWQIRRSQRDNSANFDPLGSYTGRASDGGMPQQDADDL